MKVIARSNGCLLSFSHLFPRSVHWDWNAMQERSDEVLIEDMDALNAAICVRRRELFPVHRGGRSQTAVGGLRGQGPGPLVVHPLRDLLLEGQSVDRLCPRPSGPPLDLGGVYERGAQHRQGHRAHPVRHARDRGLLDPVGQGGVLGTDQGEGGPAGPPDSGGGRGGGSGEVLVLVVLRSGPPVRPAHGASLRPGAVVIKGIERTASSLPVMPGEEAPYDAPARRADALVAMASAVIASDADSDRATVVIHAREEVLASEILSSAQGGCELEGGGVIHPQEAIRAACSGRIQWITEDAGGNPVKVGVMSREPSGWMLRQLKYRDRTCVFPGCGSTRFLVAHHIRWWKYGGRTEMGNLVLVCQFHHKIVHEYGWSLVRKADGTVRWYRPDGRRSRAGPSPPPKAPDSRRHLAAAAGGC